VILSEWKALSKVEVISIGKQRYLLLPDHKKITMIAQQQPSKAIHIALWIAQVILAAFFLLGALLKFLPIETISALMPWTGQLPSLAVRFLGVLDVLAVAGLLLPSLLRIKPVLTAWTAVCIIVLMGCATAFHISRGEASVIGGNIFAAVFAAFIAWGRLTKAPITSK
jgi:uncharacterized membrane protein